MNVSHPAARMLVDMSRGRDVEAGDGTIIVVVIADSLLAATMQLLNKWLHVQAISDGFLLDSLKCEEVIRTKLVILISYSLMTAATSLNS